MATTWVALTLLVLVAVQRAMSVTPASAQNRLLKKLLRNYSYTSMRPVYNQTAPTRLEFRLLLTQVIDLNERDQTFEVEAWLKQRWTDEYMIWDPDQHDGVDHLYVHRSKIWLPDTTLFKNVDRNFESYKDIPVQVHSTGVVVWATPVILKTTCIIDARLFPFDTQVCQLRFTSWAYDITEINLTEYEEDSRQRYYTDVGVWELREVTVVREEIGYSGDVVFPELSYFIHLKRRPLFHVLQVILPCVLLSLLNLMVFVLPPESGEKISLGVTNLLSLVLFQQLISLLVPPTANNAPIIGYYFTPMIALACTSIVCTVAVLNVFYRDNGHPIPRCVRLIVFDILARLVCHPARTKSSPNTIKSRPDNERLLIQETGKMETASRSTNSSGNATGKIKASSPSVPRYHLVDNWTDDHHDDATQQYPKTLSPTEMEDKERHNCEAESRHEERQTTALPGSHDWRDVALVIDRTALALSSIITVCSMVATSASFAIQLQEADS